MLAAVGPQTLAAPRQYQLLVRRSGAPVRRQLAAAALPRCAAGGSGAQDQLPARLARSATAAAAAALLLLGPAAPPPAVAEISTVTAQQATEMAKPLKKQKVNKGRIWALFVLGATALFGSTVVLENNDKWFPAISRANRAMKQSREAAEAREKAAAVEQAQFEARLAAVQQERAVDAAVDAAVLEGLLEARKRSASSGGGSGSDGAGEAAGSGGVAPLAAAAAAAAEAVPAVPAVAAVPEAPEAAAEPEPESANPASAGAAASSSAPADAEPAASSPPADAEPAASSPPADAEPAAISTPSSGSSSGSAAEEPRKPLFEISASQIDASAKQRMEELQQEVERRKATAAGAPPEA